MDRLRFGRLLLWAVFPGAMFWALFGPEIAVPYLLIAIPLALVGHLLIGAVGERLGGIFHPRADGVTDDRAVIKGMYALAMGEIGVSKYREAEKIYLQIIKEYPSEVDAHVFLGKLYEERMGTDQKAAKQYGKANRLLSQLKLEDYKYAGFLKKRLAELSAGNIAPENSPPPAK